MNAGSDHEPPTDPTAAADQMRDATQRLRDRAWMVSPLTTPAVTPTESSEAGEPV